MKYLITIMVIALSFTIGMSQDNRMEKKANEKVQELDQLLIAQNPDLALSEEQKEQIFQVHLQKMIDVKAINKSDATDEEKKKAKKKIYKQVGKKITNEILNKEQRKAKRDSKDKAE
jgi:ABC-type transporter MlaC component